MIWQRLALLGVAAVMVLLLVIRGRHNGEQPVVSAFFRVPQPTAWVQVRGAAKYRGTYPLFDNNMTVAVIKMSEPVCGLKGTQLSDTGLPENQRGFLVTIHCPSAGGAGYTTVAPLPPGQCLTLGIPFSLSHASLGELDLVPGIGPVLAERIVVYRQKNGDFRRIEELMQVKGIADKKLEKLKQYLTP